MRLRLLAIGMGIVALLASRLAHAVNVEHCTMVANGPASVISFSAQTTDGRIVSLNGILFGPLNKRKTPALVMLPGSNGLVVPYCYGAIARQFADFGIISLIVAPTTARDQKGSQFPNYSFSDLARYADGAADALAGFDQVDGNRIGLWGHSRGGLAVIEAITADTPGKFPFVAAVATAPICPARAKQPRVPMLLMIGEKDTDVSVSSCVKFAEMQSKVSTFDFQLLPKAGHSFWASDTPGYVAASAELATTRLKKFLAKHRLHLP